MKAIPDLVYDVGANDGSDSAYYLAKGMRVVAVEPIPGLAANLRRRFAAEIAAGRYVLLEVAIAESEGEARFWICDTQSEWSSLDRSLAARRGAEHHGVTVRTRPFADILSEHGLPYYCKVDIEGSDHLCVRALSAERRPPYISIEMSWTEADRHMSRLHDIGYRKFKIVSQSTRSQLSLPLLLSARAPTRARLLIEALERRARGVTRDRDWLFPPGSSGPFAEKTPGRWTSHARAQRDWRRLTDLTRGRPTVGIWYDIHAK